jgi:transcriptional regulator with XRE-family HTH domain
MNFADNLIYLRKRENLSQEALADRLEVSRQAVYKWESGQSYPETEKLIAMSKLFNITIDELINKETVFEEKTESLKLPFDRQLYIKHSNKFSLIISSSVSLIIFSVALLILLSWKYADQEIIFLVPFFTLIAISVIMLILTGLNDEQFKNEYEPAKECYNKKEKNKFKKRFNYSIAFSIGLIIFSVIVEIILNYFFENEDWTPSVMLSLIAVAVYFLVYYGMQKDIFFPEEKKIKEDKDKKSLVGKICTVIMLIATVAFLIMGLCFNLWKICWIVYIVGGILCGIASVIFQNSEK